MSLHHLARIISISLLASFSVAMITHANEPLSLDALLETVRQGRITDTEQNRKRVEAFRSDSLNQRNLLETTKREIVLCY